MPASENSILTQVFAGIKKLPGQIIGGPVDVSNLLLGAVTGKGVSGFTDTPVGGSKQINSFFGMGENSSGLAEDVTSVVGNAIIPAGGSSKLAILLPALIKQHGSARLFNAFKREFYLSGEGAAAFGEGVYTTDKLGEHYANVAYNNNLFRADSLANEAAALEWQLTDRFAPGKPRMSADQVAEIRSRLAEIRADKEAATAGLGKFNYKVELPAGDYLQWDTSNADLIAKNSKLKFALQDYPEDVNMASGKELYKYLTKVFAGSDMSASQALDSIGIKGHIFYDGSSRSKGAGTMNQVTYNPELIKILDVTKLE